VSDTDSQIGTDRLLPLLLVALVPLLACFPPETRGEALVGCSLLIGLAALRSLRGNSATLFAGACSVLAFGLFSALLGQSLPFALWPLSMALLALAVALAARRVAADPRVVEWVSWALLLSGTLVALHAVYQKIWGFDSLLQLVESDPLYPDRAAVITRLGRGRAFAAFATPAALGGYLAMTLPVAIAVAFRVSGLRRLAVGVSCLLQAGALFASASATATVALLAAVTLASLRVRGVRRLLIPVGVALTVLLVAVIWVRGERLIDVADREGPLYQRAGNIRVAAEIARDNPWLGAGPGSYSEQYPHYRGPGDNESRHAHNIVAELIADWGLPVGLALSLLFLSIFTLPLWRHSSDGIRLALAVGLAAFGVQNLADFGAFMPSLLWSAALIAGLLAVPPEVHRRRAGPMSLVYAAALLLALVIAVGSGRAMELRREARAEALNGAFDEAIVLSARGVRWAPWSADAAAQLAAIEFDAAVGAGEETEDLRSLMDRAGALAPERASVRALRARWRMAVEDHHGGLADLRQACRFYPREERYCAAAEEWGARLAGSNEAGGP